MDINLLNTIQCQPTNKTLDNFVLLISKNTTYSPCFCLSGHNLPETMGLIGNMTDHLKENPDLGSIKWKEIKFIKPYIVQLFEDAEQYFLLMTHKPDNTNRQFEIYQEFCNSMKVPCFYALSQGIPTFKPGDVNDISTFAEYFLGYTDNEARDYEVPYLYYIDNSETFPSLKYKIKGPF
jgi:hypothetical protein